MTLRIAIRRPNTRVIIVSVYVFYSRDGGRVGGDLWLAGNPISIRVGF